MGTWRSELATSKISKSTVLRMHVHYISMYESLCRRRPKCHHDTEDYGMYLIFPVIWKIKCMRKQCVPDVSPRTPGYTVIN